MKDCLEELRQKRKKIAFLLGEKVEALYRSGLLRFLYTSDGIKEEEEVLKLLRLLNYMEERINKISDICSEEDKPTADDLSEKAEKRRGRDLLISKT